MFCAGIETLTKTPTKKHFKVEGVGFLSWFDGKVIKGRQKQLVDVQQEHEAFSHMLETGNREECGLVDSFPLAFCIQDSR